MRFSDSTSAMAVPSPPTTLCSSTETNNVINGNSDYYVDIDGETVKVDFKSDEEYSCLLNCMEGYFIYGIGREDSEEEDDDSNLGE